MVIPVLIILILLYLTKCFPFNKQDKQVSEGYDNVDKEYDTALNTIVGDEDYNKIKKQQRSVDHVNSNYQVNADFTSDGQQSNTNLTYFDSSTLLPDENKKVKDEGWEYKFGSTWDESNPQIAKVDGNAWLNERKFLGIYSVASSLRNATHDLRRDVPNPQMVVSPWNNTTIMPDANSKGLNTL
jgi:hypothetical protein